MRIDNFGPCDDTGDSVPCRTDLRALLGDLTLVAGDEARPPLGYDPEMEEYRAGIAMDGSDMEGFR